MAGIEGRLPFERGTYTCGAVDIGSEYYDPTNKQWVQIVKNTDAAAVTGKRFVKWETPASYECDYAVARASGPSVAGVVDPKLSSTVPVNAYYYVVTAGICTVAVGSGAGGVAVTDGGLCVVSSTAVAANKGMVCQIAAVAALLTTEVEDTRYVVGVGHAAGPLLSAAGANVQLRLALRR